MKPPTPTRAVAYLRVSTDDQQLGPDAQRAAIAEYAARHGVLVVAEHADHGVSGAAKLDKRPGMLDALASLREHGAGLLLVAKRDRLARDVVTAALIEAAAARVGARVVSAAGEGTDADENDPAAQLLRRLIDAFAEYERALIAARTRAALAVKSRRGERVGGVPYGFEAVEGRLVKVAHEQAGIVRARQLRAGGLSLAAVGQQLAREGWRSRAGSPMAAVQVQRILERGET